MTPFFLFLVSLSLLAPLSIAAPSSDPTSLVRCKFTPGETLRYLIQRDPYFYNPEGAVDAVDSEAAYQPPIVERLTETVQAVDSHGNATLTLTLTPEPGFEDEAHPQPPLTHIVTVTPSGRILTIAGGPLGGSPAERDLLRGLPPVSAVSAGSGTAGYLSLRRTLPVAVILSRTPNHDGLLLRTTRAAQSDQCVFDSSHGYLVRTDSTLTITSSLLMTQRGRRGVADFGRVIPHVQVIQAVSLDLQEVSSPQLLH